MATPIVVAVIIDYNLLADEVNARMGTNYLGKYVYNIHQGFAHSDKVLEVIKAILSEQPRTMDVPALT